MRVRVLSYGGVINEISVPDRHGVFGNVVLTLRDLQAYEARPNFSSLIGRYANRISGGGFTLGGIRYNLPSNSNGISSHGGPHGFGSRRWTGRPFQRGHRVGVVLHYLSSDGENGYPGNLAVNVTFTLTESDTLRIDYEASTDKPTVLNLTHHAFFNLAGGGSVYDHRVQVFADRYTPIDARKIPTGRLDLVAGTALDLRASTRLGDLTGSADPQIVFGGGLDHNFVLRKASEQEARAGELTLAVRVEDPTSGRVLEMRTNEPGLQVYAGNGFDGSLEDAAGRAIERGAGLALETQHFPDSPNRPEFPSAALERGRVFRSATELRFSTDAQATRGRLQLN